MYASVLLTLLLPVVYCQDPTVFWIRHGEKPDSGNGLSPQGVQRSQCLVNVFGDQSDYNIGYIMAQTPQDDGSQERPYLTVKPLADSLGMEIDTSCQRDDAKCVKKAIENFDGPGNVLVCWEHGALTDNMKELGAKHAPDYPDNSFDLIYPDPSPFKKVDDPISEDCPGLDDGSSNSTFRRRGSRLTKRQW